MNVEPIGVVESPVREAVDSGWGSVVSRIAVAKDMAPGLRGLEEFSHAIVVFFMHESDFDRRGDLVRRPQGRVDMPEVGIFAQRAKHRPNPIGITAVELIAVEGNVLSVRGLDAIDGTPVLDIKPYVPEYDRVVRPATPEWMARLMTGYF
jgi:tRNA-Thr(GGU) m(6)t(6)A37 methyltransferase TsaA